MESKPWDMKTDDVRLADSLPTFIIFCEDEVSEFYYFKWFETDIIKVNVINGQKSMLTNLKKAIAYCTNNEIMTYNGLEYSFTGEGMEIWCVYDRDVEKNPELINEGNQEFNICLHLATTSNINLAWSNDAFELWVLLHLLDIDSNDKEFMTRQHYYEWLTNYFKNHRNPNFDLQKALTHASFGYKKDMKHKGNFISIVMTEILPSTVLAIQRAKKLVDAHADTVNHFEKKPCTMVYKLVERLLETGRKPLPIS